jgi:hypothetical protein
VFSAEHACTLGCQIFLDAIYQNGGKSYILNYQMAIKYTNVGKIYQMAAIYSKWPSVKYSNNYHF